MIEADERKNVDWSEQYSQADMLLSEQYREIRRKHTLEPEKRLMLAILEDAVKCFQTAHSEAVSARRDTGFLAEEWIFKEDPDWPFSFDNVCEFLDIDPFYLRRGLSRWKKAKPRERVAQLRRLTESTGRRRKR